jgi:perosamine synthetase
MYNVLFADEVMASAAAAQLKAQGIETRPFFLGLHEQPALRTRGLFENLRFPVAERLARQGLCLPSGAGLTEQQVAKVVEGIKSALALAGDDAFTLQRSA